MIISRMTAEDIPEIIEIENSSFPIPWEESTFEKELSNLLASYLVAKIDNTVVGFIGAWFIMDECQITNIAVHEKYRRQGIASQLVAELLKKCKKHETSYVMLEVRVNNFSAQKLYSKFGFKEEAIRRNYYKNPDGTRDDALIMSQYL